MSILTALLIMFIAMNVQNINKLEKDKAVKDASITKSVVTKDVKDKK